MKFSISARVASACVMSARVLTIGFTAAVIIAVGGSNSYAGTHRAKLIVAKAPLQHSVSLRYYGGPKSPMYP
jgi:hypothetical protein